MNESSTREHETLNVGKKRRDPYLFIAMIVIAILGTVASVEIVRHLKSMPTQNQNAQAVSSADNASAGYPRSLRDGSGEALTIPRRPRRIVSQTLGTDQILFDICDRERIV